MRAPLKSSLSATAGGQGGLKVRLNPSFSQAVESKLFMVKQTSHSRKVPELSKKNKAPDTLQVSIRTRILGLHHAGRG